MTRFLDQDLTGAEFRECVLSGASFVGVVMQDAVIDGLVTNLVVNGVEVMGFVESELDRRHPVRVLLRSSDPADLTRGLDQLTRDWDETITRLRRRPGLEHQSVNGEWSALETLRHLVFVHDSWFRRCCLASTQTFTAIGLPHGPRDEGGGGLQPDAAAPTLDEVVAVRAAQQDELSAWLAAVSADQLAATAPVPDDGGWPPHANGRTVGECLGVVLDETWWHHRFCVRDLDLITASSDREGTGG